MVKRPQVVRTAVLRLSDKRPDAQNKLYFQTGHFGESRIMDVYRGATGGDSFVFVMHHGSGRVQLNVGSDRGGEFIVREGRSVVKAASLEGRPLNDTLWVVVKYRTGTSTERYRISTVPQAGEQQLHMRPSDDGMVTLVNDASFGFWAVQ
jgi:hypothetical protein